jgi:DMSO/TMAO reductase YedYZ molybdopterin-dependent catalytic subunit
MSKRFEGIRFQKERRFIYGPIRLMTMSWKRGMFITLALALVLVSGALIYVQLKSTQSNTSNQDFFYVSLTEPLQINASDWTLVVNGTVDNPYTITYSELLSMPNKTETATLRCVDGPSGRAEYTGVPLRYLLEQAGVQNGSKKVIFRAPDGYSTDLTIKDAMLDDVLLAYSMNNETLPANQGYPAKLVVPEQWGYKWAKWVTNIEVVDTDYKGYWESRGWADNAYLSLRTDWWWHALGLSLAAVIGGFAGITGVINRRRRLSKRPPQIPPIYHQGVGYVFVFLLLAIFSWWAIETFSLRSNIFYSIHGLLAVTATILGGFGLITGIQLARKKEDARGSHWFFTIVGYAFILFTMMTGLLLAFR